MATFGKRVKVKQRDIMDCGAACLMSVAAHYKLHIPVSKIRQYANTDKKGTNVLGMVEAAEKMGFMAKGVKGDYNALLKIPKPAIAHFQLKNGWLHYVVLLEVTPKGVKIMDPATGEIEKLDKEDFSKKWTGILILLVPSDTFEIKKERVSNWVRLMYLLKPHRAVLFQALIGAILFSVLGLSTSIYIQKITDFVFVNGNKNLLNIMSIGMIAIIVVKILLGIFQTIFTLKTGQLIDARLILGYYKHLLHLPQRFFDTMQTGEIVSRIGDAVKIRAFINNTIIDLLVDILIVFFSFVLMLIYSWKMALIVMIIIPLYIVLYIITDKLNKKTERKIMEEAAELESHLVESLNTVSTIKRFGMEQFFGVRTENSFVKLLNTGYKSGLNSILTSYISAFVSSTFTIVVLWVGSYFVLANELTPGELMSFYAILGYFIGPLNGLIGVNKTIQNAFIASDRLFEIMDLETESNCPLVLERNLLGNIRFVNVSFRYGSRVDVFTDFNLEIEQGKITAIVGESGSGKSTLIHLLQNIYPIGGGKIFIDYMDITQVKNESLRKIVGVVPQHIDLFKGTIAENIAIGDFMPDVNKITQIINSIGLQNFIDELPNGLNTDIGENGQALSGGQRQKIAFARMLYRNPEIIILDEASSALDTESEEQLMKVVKQLREEGKTVIMIAHRLSTVTNADTIVVMEKGKVVEQGSHNDLYEQQQKYYNLWQKQMPKFN